MDDSSCQVADDSQFSESQHQKPKYLKVLGVSTDEMKRANALKKIGATEELIESSKEILRDMTTASHEKVENVTGYTVEQTRRHKSLKVLGVSEEIVDEARAKALGRLRRRESIQMQEEKEAAALSSGILSYSRRNSEQRNDYDSNGRSSEQITHSDQSTFGSSGILNYFRRNSEHKYDRDSFDKRNEEINNSDQSTTTSSGIFSERAKGTSNCELRATGNSNETHMLDLQDPNTSTSLHETGQVVDETRPVERSMRKKEESQL